MTRAPKRPRDTNQLGKLVVDIATGEAEDKAETKPVDGRKRLAGLKGGAARAQAPDSQERSRTARVAAGARWRA